MFDLNKIFISGRLTKSVKHGTFNLQNRPGRGSYALFHIKVPRKDSNISDYFQVNALGRSADYISKYGHKGSFVEVNGALKQFTDNYNKRLRVNIQTRDVKVIK